MRISGSPELPEQRQTPASGPKRKDDKGTLNIKEVVSSVIGKIGILPVTHKPEKDPDFTEDAVVMPTKTVAKCVETARTARSEVTEVSALNYLATHDVSDWLSTFCEELQSVPDEIKERCWNTLSRLSILSGVQGKEDPENLANKMKTLAEEKKIDHLEKLLPQGFDLADLVYKSAIHS